MSYYRKTRGGRTGTKGQEGDEGDGVSGKAPIEGPRGGIVDVCHRDIRCYYLIMGFTESQRVFAFRVSQGRRQNKLCLLSCEGETSQGSNRHESRDETRRTDRQDQPLVRRDEVLKPQLCSSFHSNASAPTEVICSVTAAVPLELKMLLLDLPPELLDIVFQQVLYDVGVPNTARLLQVNSMIGIVV